MKSFNIDGWQCDYEGFPDSDKIVYLIYPALVPLSDKLIEKLSSLYKLSVAVIYVAAEKWNNALTPWPEPGESKGFPPFAGEAENFLKIITEKIIPTIEQNGDLKEGYQRSLIGVSLSGLFTLWQWMKCDVFKTIGSLSGSFWYNGFLTWFDNQEVPKKDGKAFFLLGKEEPLAKIKAYQSVGQATQAIVERLKENGIDATFEWVAGNHFSQPVHRLERAFEALFG